MDKRTSVVNISGDHEETIQRLAKHLGTSKIRRKIFNTVYGRGTRPQSKKQIMDKAGIHARDAQQTQNELDHLSKHHLIVRSENKGVIKDGSRYLYSKDPTVRANKDEIIKFADNRRASEDTPTKRSPKIKNMVIVKKITKQNLKKQKELRVLYLTASPDKDSHLRVDAEVRRVQESVRGSVFRDKIKIEYRPAADLNTLINGLNDLRPQIIHFSGHGNEDGILADTGKIGKSAAKMLSFDLLAKALDATDHPVEAVVLNSCNSASAKKTLLSATKVLIAMQVSVTDIAAAVFAQKFYAAIASGQSVNASFKQGKLAVESASIAEADTPALFHSAEINPAKLVLT